MLDQLPAWLRHLLLLMAAAGFTVISDAAQGAGGVTGVDWQTTLIAALNAAAIALVLWATPLTRQYGVGARTE